MTVLNANVCATLTLSMASSSTIKDLMPMAFSILRQSDIDVYRVDLAFHGEDAAFETDEGRIELTCERRESGRRSVRIRCDALVRGSRETVRQLCYQITQRIVARDQVETIFWHPTRQSLSPAEFRWSALLDLPQRFAGPRTIYAAIDGPTLLT